MSLTVKCLRLPTAYGISGIIELGTERGTVLGAVYPGEKSKEAMWTYRPPCAYSSAGAYAWIMFPLGLRIQPTRDPTVANSRNDSFQSRV